MQEKKQMSAATAESENPTAGEPSRKRQWVTPAVQKLKVAQTELGPPVGDDGVVSGS